MTQCYFYIFRVGGKKTKLALKLSMKRSGFMVKNQEVDMFIVSHLPFPPIFTARLKMSADFNTFAII